MNPRTTSAVHVFKGDAHVGELQRTEHGARFAYLPAYAEAHRRQPLCAIAFTLPVRAEPYEVFGTNLHPFFAGLLPEGLRLRAWVRTLKTSEDDLFSLLTATGSDTVGDVSIAAVGETPREHSPSADIAHLESASFAELLAQSLHEHGLPKEATIAGVQPKLSAAMISFPLRSKQKGRSYILKLTPPEYPRLAENEAFFMRLAKRVGFDVAKHVLVRDRNGMSGLLVERFDRVRLADGQTRHLPQEDACQLLGRYPADKYRLTLSEVAAALEVCSAPLPEQLKLLRIQAFSYLIANGDMHAKNVSVQTLGARVCLTPLYDVLSTLPYGDRSLALAMEGRDTHLKATHFIALGERLGVRAKAVQQMLSQLVTKLAPHAAELGEIGFDAKKTAHLERTMRERLSDLAP